MHCYVYRWSLQPQPDLRVELEVSAESAGAARRAIHRFLREHDGVAWRLEAVSRARSSGGSVQSPPVIEAAR